MRTGFAPGSSVKLYHCSITVRDPPMAFLSRFYQENAAIPSVRLTRIFGQLSSKCSVVIAYRACTETLQLGLAITTLDAGVRVIVESPSLTTGMYNPL